MPGGCRRTGKTGQLERQNCNQCVRQGFCEIEPRARELGEMLAQQWVSCKEETPPPLEAILFLEYPSDMPSGTVRHGYYESDSETYVEWISGQAWPRPAVIAWLLVPDVPAAIFKSHERLTRRARKQPSIQFKSLEG
jgi:hypothetical protein